MFKQKNKQIQICQPLDLSSIEDDYNQNSPNGSNHQLVIQQMGVQNIDQSDFRNNVRDLLLTQKHNKQDQYDYNEQVVNLNNDNSQQCDEQFNQFQGQPLKGSFLRDMEILAKTLSFQTTVYDIYGDNDNSQFQLNSEQEQKRISILQTLNNLVNFRNLQTQQKQLKKKYIIDFFISQNKKKKHQNNQNRTNKRKKSVKTKLITDNHSYSTKSVSNHQNARSQKISNSKQISKRQPSKKKSKTKISMLDLRKSQYKSDTNFYLDQKKKVINSPLRKIGKINSNLKILRKSQIASFSQLEKKKKKIQQKFSLGAKA